MVKFVLTLIILSATFTTGIMTDSIYEFTMNDIDNKPVQLSKYKGKVVLIVNVASKCGFTYQYEALQKLYAGYKDKDFVILGFPANNFMNQEPGTNSEIKEFCTLEYGVEFPMFSKISVKGKDKAELFNYLTSTDNPDFDDEVSWNFEKFLINKEGKLIRRFKSKTEPDSKELKDAINSAISS